MDYLPSATSEKMFKAQQVVLVPHLVLQLLSVLFHVLKVFVYVFLSPPKNIVLGGQATFTCSGN